MGQDIYGIGEIPPLGEVPRYMHAAMIRQERYGAPADAIRIEQTEVPPVGRGQILLLVMAAGVNYNGVWAALGALPPTSSRRAASRATRTTSTSRAPKGPAWCGRSARASPSTESATR